MKGGAVKYLIACLLLLPGTALGQSSAGDGQKHGYGPGGSATMPQVGIVGGIVRADTSAKALTMTSDGYVRVADASPDRDANLRFESIIENSSIAYNVGDSSTVIDVHRLRHMKLLIKATPKTTSADTSAVVRLAFQIRTHLNGQSDSSSTFVEYLGGISNIGVSAGAADSNVYGHLATGGRGVTGGVPWSGEFVVQIQAKRSAHGNSIVVNGHDWYYPSGISLPLDNVAGRDFWGDYISLRVRNLTNTPCAVTVHLIGTPL